MSCLKYKPTNGSLKKEWFKLGYKLKILITIWSFHALLFHIAAKHNKADIMIKEILFTKKITHYYQLISSICQDMQRLRVKVGYLFPLVGVTTYISSVVMIGSYANANRTHKKRKKSLTPLPLGFLIWFSNTWKKLWWIPTVKNQRKVFLFV